MTEVLVRKRFDGASNPITVGGTRGAGKSTLVEALSADREAAMPSFVDDGLSGLRSITGSVFLLVVDAAEGLVEDARRQAIFAHTAGYRHLVVALNKMDVSNWRSAAFSECVAELARLESKFSFTSSVVIPVAAIVRETIGCPVKAMPWYDGPSLPAYLRQLDSKAALQVPQAHLDHQARQFAARVACVGEQPVLPGRDYHMEFGSQTTRGSISSVKYRIDPETLRRDPVRSLAPGEIGVCIISTAAEFAFGGTAEGHETGRLVLTDRYDGAVVAVCSVDFALRRGTNIHVQSLAVSKTLRASIKKQRPCVVWFTGLSGSGKSTIANAMERQLAEQGCHTYLLDGDNIRHGLNKDLGFTAADRVENIRRVGEVAKLFVDAGTIVLCSFISPFRAERAAVRWRLEKGEFIEVHVKTPIEVCEARDVKGLYAKARAGKLPNFTGIDSPYEPPEQPDVAIDTSDVSAEEAAARIIALLRERGMLAAQA